MARLPDPAGPRWALAGVFALALLVRLIGIGWGLPDFYEEAYPYRRAWEMWGWGPDRPFTLNPNFFRYPSLTIYAQFIGQALLYPLLHLTGVVSSSLDFRALYETDPRTFVIAGRAITALFGAATVFPVWRLGREAGGETVGLGAAALVALSPALVSKSQVIEVDAPLACFTAAALASSVRLMSEPTLRRALESGAWVGLAAGTKYPGAILLLPLWLALALARRSPATAGSPRPSAAAATRRSTRAGRDRDPKPGRSVMGFGRLQLGLLAGVAAAATFLITSPYVVLDHRAFWAAFLAERQHMQLGHFGSTPGAAWREYAGAWFSSLFGWPLGVAALAGLIWHAGVRRERWAMVLGAFIVVYFGLVGSWEMKADRYLLPLVPAATVLGVALTKGLVHRALPSGAGRIAAGTLAIAVLGAPFWSLHRREAGRSALDPRTEARRWIESNVPAGAMIAAEQYGPTLWGPMKIRTFDPELQRAILRGPGPYYATLGVPMLQVGPERAAPLYDPSLYRDADLVIVSASVRDRYEREAERFPRQVAFYDTLERRYREVARFVPRGSIGSALTLYAPPESRPPYALRGEPPPLSMGDGESNPAVGYFYFNLGIDAEAFGFHERAIEAYRVAIRRGEVGQIDAQVAALRIGACLLALGRERAIAYLDTAAAPHRVEAEALAFLRVAVERAPGRLRSAEVPDLRAAVRRRG